MDIIDGKKYISRKEFLSVLGGAAAVVFLSKFVGSKTAMSSVFNGRLPKASSGYGSSTYGG